MVRLLHATVFWFLLLLLSRAEGGGDVCLGAIGPPEDGVGVHGFEDVK